MVIDQQRKQHADVTGRYDDREFTGALQDLATTQADGLKRAEGYRPLTRQAFAEIIKGRMPEAIDH